MKAGTSLGLLPLKQLSAEGYSPNLNPIERLWKFLKAKLRCKYYDDFQLFQETIDSIIDGTHTEYKDQISSLIGEKVQL